MHNFIGNFIFIRNLYIILYITLYIIVEKIKACLLPSLTIFPKIAPFMK